MKKMRKILAVLLTAGLITGSLGIHAFADEAGLDENTMGTASEAESVEETAADSVNDEEIPAENETEAEPFEAGDGEEATLSETEEETTSEPEEVSEELQLDACYSDATSGYCGVDGGTNARWSYADGVLTISGSGKMQDYNIIVDLYTMKRKYDIPWKSLKEEITKVVISGVSNVGAEAFDNCHYLQTIEFKDQSCTTIGEGAFQYCYALTSVTLPDSVSEIKSDAFACSNNLEKVSAPGVTHLESDAFTFTVLREFALGSQAGAEIDFGAFSFCSKVESITVAEDNPYYSTKDGVIFNKSGSRLCYYPSAKQGASYTIPSSVQEIGDYAFTYSSCLKKIDWGASKVTKIGTNAFSGSSINEIKIPDSVTELGDYAFAGCLQMETIEIGSGLTELPIGCFKGNYLLKSIVLPENIKAVKSSCFSNCTSLKSVKIYALTEIPEFCFYYDTNLTDVQLNVGLEYIYTKAFCYNKNLKKVVIPSTVRLIGYNAFPSETELVFKSSGYQTYSSNGYAKIDTVTYTGTNRYDYAFKVLDLVNQQRSANGLSPYVMDDTLMEYAMQRAAELVTLFSHTRPDGSYVFNMSNLLRAENIAFGQVTPDSVMDSWMNSDGHRANILEPYYTTIGVGCFEYNGTIYWVQWFGNGSNTSDCTKPANKQVAQTTAFYFESFEEAQGDWFVSGNSSYNYELYLTETQKTLSVGETYTISAALRAFQDGSLNSYVPFSGSDLKFTSSNGNVASVSNTGVITAKSDGTAVITVSTSANNYSAAFTVKVVQEVVDPAVAPTCTKTGLTEGKHCAVCGEVLVAQKTVPATGHKYENHICSNCGIVDHDYEGLLLVDGTWCEVKDGAVVSDCTRFVEYDGRKFYVENGVLVAKDGLVLDPEDSSVWYYCAGGMVQDQYSGLALYSGEWFMVTEGKLDTTLTAFVKYDTGLFVVACGRVVTEAKGLVQDPDTPKWYYVADGMVQSQYTGLAQYDNEWFYIVNGKLAEDFTGTVKYDGSYFNIVNGMLKEFLLKE